MQCDLNLSYILITPAKTLFPNKVTFTGTRDKDFNIFFLGDMNPTLNSHHTVVVNRIICL